MKIGDIWYVGGPMGDDGKIMPEFLRQYPDFKPEKYIVVDIQILSQKNISLLIFGPMARWHNGF